MTQGSARVRSPNSPLLPDFARQAGFIALRHGPAWCLYREPTEVLVATDALSLQRSLARLQRHVESGGEAAGLLAYEAGYALEPRLSSLLPRCSLPLAWFGLYEGCEIWDDVCGPEGIRGGLLDSFDLSSSWREYCNKLALIRRLIQAGEVYQINFTARMGLKAKTGAWETFTALFRRHPVPYAAFVNTGERQIVSLSPELFFEIERGRITVKPMKGTMARGRFCEEDLIAAEQLRRSEKNRAENVMIVDLMRNDLGRICRTGTVKVPSLFEVERYPSVWQMTSTIQGELLGDCGVETIFRALFPSGSVTGAPKIRAMEQIAQLEDPPRGVYTGAIGFWSPGRARFNVAIRTIEFQQQHGIMGIGGGITYDSKPAEEWEECQWKASFLLQSQPEFKIIETLYWERKYRLLDAHVARMKKSAEYFGFACSESKVRRELRKLAARLPARPQRVRALLSKEGQLEITHSDFVASQFGRVGISNRRVSSQDRFLFHKTTNRDAYEKELVAARERGLDDVLFFNEKGDLTEGTVHNVFLVKDGVWRTPAIECGVLPGTFRARILRTRANACEAILGMEDLKNADAVYLCNSVRGAFPVKVEYNAAAAARVTVRTAS
jgi:para-aminobenzoate synthetase / 4-amino-4-deoxychorismate lyase